MWASVALLALGAAALAAPDGAAGPPATNTPFVPPCVAWLRLAQGDRATVGWTIPAGSTATGIAMAVWALWPGESNRLAEVHDAADACSYDLDGLKPLRDIRVVVTASGPTGTCWQHTIEWTQPGASMLACQLFAAIPLGPASPAEPAVRRTEQFIMECSPGWDQFYVSGASARSAGWRARGLSLSLECDGRERKLFGYSHDSGGACLQIPDDALGSPTNGFRFLLRYDGKGSRGLSAPLFLLRWSPKVNFVREDK